jgi:hypothetical protein
VDKQAVQGAILGEEVGTVGARQLPERFVESLDG